ncbi:MAG TPA: asparagine synthetase B, partial [Candidatus Nanoarchaeia archaeon]|nr:asparagine synthetase B [Candidatus Nanoarchaeia archaeon]
DSSLNKPTIVKLDEAYLVFEGRTFAANTQMSAAEIIKKHLTQNYLKFAQSVLKKVEGEYALIITRPSGFITARDPVGVQPLYFGETSEIAAIASNRAALWRLGIDEPKSFPPGNVGTITHNGFKFAPVRVLKFSEPRVISITEAAARLQKLLQKSVLQRVTGQKEVAVAFSGGLDSSIVASLAKNTGVGVQLIHVSMKDQPETEEAIKAAEQLELPLHVHLFNEPDVERDIHEVVGIVEEPDPIKAAVGVPFFWNAQKASAEGLHVMLAGQGADELFGGYQRYVNEYILDGDNAVRRTMFHDVNVIHESNIERDEKVCNYFDVELRLPFGSFAVAKFAMSLPTELKFERKADSLRKLTLRKAADNIGIPKNIADKPKKAVQYSTGINNVLKRIAKRHGLTLAEYVNKIFEESKKRATLPEECVERSYDSF